MFKELLQKLESMDIQLTIGLTTNQKIVVQVKCKPKVDLGVEAPYYQIKGTAEELDESFVAKLNEPLEIANDKFAEIGFYKEQLNMIVDSTKKELDDKSSTKKPVAKSAATKTTTKPATKTTEVKQVEQTVVETPVIIESNEEPVLVEQPNIEELPVIEVVEEVKTVIQPNTNFDEENVVKEIPQSELPSITIDLPEFD